MIAIEAVLFGLWFITTIVFAMFIHILMKVNKQQSEVNKQTCSFANFLAGKIKENQKNIEKLSDLYFELSNKKKTKQKENTNAKSNKKSR